MGEPAIDPSALAAQLILENDRLRRESEASRPGYHALDTTQVQTLVEDQAFIDALINNDFACRLLANRLGSTLPLPTWVIGHQYSKISGFSEPALKAKRGGVWADQEGRLWTLAGDGKMYYNWRAIDDWVAHSAPMRK